LHYRVAADSDDIYLVDDAESVQSTLDEYFGIAPMRPEQF
jgi:hypothetical protein